MKRLISLLALCVAIISCSESCTMNRKNSRKPSRSKQRRTQRSTSNNASHGFKLTKAEQEAIDADYAFSLMQQEHQDINGVELSHNESDGSLAGASQGFRLTKEEQIALDADYAFEMMLQESLAARSSEHGADQEEAVQVDTSSLRDIGCNFPRPKDAKCYSCGTPPNYETSTCPLKPTPCCDREVCVSCWKNAYGNISPDNSECSFCKRDLLLLKCENCSRSGEDFIGCMRKGSCCKKLLCYTCNDPKPFPILPNGMSACPFCVTKPFNFRGVTIEVSSKASQSPLVSTNQNNDDIQECGICFEKPYMTAPCCNADVCGACWEQTRAALGGQCPFCQAVDQCVQQDSSDESNSTNDPV